MSALAGLAKRLRASGGIASKREIAASLALLGLSAQDAVPVGDDCAALPLAESGGPEAGYLLFAIEGFVAELVASEPWFAGWCGVMVNVSDVAAMGGRATAIVDAIWARDADRVKPILDGMRAASAALGVPIVGGHTNTHHATEQLAVAVLGRARRLITSFDAAPGDIIVAAIDLRGRYHEPHPFFDAATAAPPERLRADLALLPEIAERGLAHAGKDISQGGLVGTLLMLLEASGVGAEVDPRAVPRPEGEAIERWLTTFPSFGFVLAAKPEHVDALIGLFRARDVACAAIGRCDTSRTLRLVEGDARELLWDLSDRPLTGCGARPRRS